jgi:hypothetical protein
MTQRTLGIDATILHRHSSKLAHVANDNIPATLMMPITEHR